MLLVFFDQVNARLGQRANRVERFFLSSSLTLKVAELSDADRKIRPDGLAHGTVHLQHKRRRLTGVPPQRLLASVGGNRLTK